MTSAKRISPCQPHHTITQHNQIAFLEKVSLLTHNCCSIFIRLIYHHYKKYFIKLKILSCVLPLTCR